MTRGRCAGCGKEDASCKKIKTHIASCPEYLELWTTDPDRALDPEEEFLRWKAHVESDDYIMAKEEATSAKYAGYRREAELKIARSKTRWGSRLTESEKTTVTSHDAQVAAMRAGDPAPTAERQAAPGRQVDGRSPQDVLDDPTASKMQKLRAQIAIDAGGG